MSDIQWTDETWNCVTGCTKVSPGCAHCYIERTPPMRMAGRKFVNGKIPLEFHENRLTKPLHWREPRRIFVNSMSDLFHEDVPDEFLDRVFAVMALCPQHTFQVLTKRAERMRQFVNGMQMARLARAATTPRRTLGLSLPRDDALQIEWPLPNVWLGVSCEGQKRLIDRWDILRQTPAAIRFLSAEPLLGPLNPTPVFDGMTKPDWIIVGGESGPGARPCRVDWIRDIVGQCKAAGVKCFVKQLGSDPREDYANREQWAGWRDRFHQIESLEACQVRMKDKKGGNPAEWSDDLRVREFPTAEATRP